ncbi:MAG: ABC transporter ATP-binding protein [Desulfovibrionales bacterium]|nr:ABC transporter ATP-binding protein [Desulfovibrionales bacterium]
MGAPLLEVKGLRVGFDTERGRVLAVDGVDFSLEPGTVLGIAGESGCGKSVTALSIMQLLPLPVARILGGEILYRGRNLLELSPQGMQEIRGKKISMIFQEPMTALNPVHSVGKQMGEVYALHFPAMSATQVRGAGVAMLERVGIPDPGAVMGKYPHQLSGGMRQRVMIAMALACEPDILIADEPTTALDVTVQAQILELIRSLQRQTGMSLILITHDMGVIAQNCQNVMVMYAGAVAEFAPTIPLFDNPSHPYTQGLLAAIPSRSHAIKSVLPTIRGNVPSLLELPKGCRFADRCPKCESICTTAPPPEKQIGEMHKARCYLL